MAPSLTLRLQVDPRFAHREDMPQKSQTIKLTAQQLELDVVIGRKPGDGDESERKPPASISYVVVAPVIAPGDQAELERLKAEKRGQTKVLLDSRVVSQEHLRIWYDSEKDKVYVKDCNSRNGTLLLSLNGAFQMESPMRREFRYELKDGHAIKLGKMIYKDGQPFPPPYLSVSLSKGPEAHETTKGVANTTKQASDVFSNSISAYGGLIDSSPISRSTSVRRSGRYGLPEPESDSDLDEESPSANRQRILEEIRRMNASGTQSPQILDLRNLSPETGNRATKEAELDELTVSEEPGAFREYSDKLDQILAARRLFDERRAASSETGDRSRAAPGTPVHDLRFLSPERAPTDSFARQGDLEAAPSAEEVPSQDATSLGAKSSELASPSAAQQPNTAAANVKLDESPDIQRSRSALPPSPAMSANSGMQEEPIMQLSSKKNGDRGEHRAMDAEDPIDDERASDEEDASEQEGDSNEEGSNDEENASDEERSSDDELGEADAGADDSDNHEDVEVQVCESHIAQSRGKCLWFNNQQTYLEGFYCGERDYSNDEEFCDEDPNYCDLHQEIWADGYNDGWFGAAEEADQRPSSESEPEEQCDSGESDDRSESGSEESCPCSICREPEIESDQEELGCFCGMCGDNTDEDEDGDEDRDEDRDEDEAEDGEEDEDANADVDLRSELKQELAGLRQEANPSVQDMVDRNIYQMLREDQREDQPSFFSRVDFDQSDDSGDSAAEYESGEEKVDESGSSASEDEDLSSSADEEMEDTPSDAFASLPPEIAVDAPVESETSPIRKPEVVVANAPVAVTPRDVTVVASSNGSAAQILPNQIAKTPVPASVDKGLQTAAPAQVRDAAVHAKSEPDLMVDSATQSALTATSNKRKYDEIDASAQPEVPAAATTITTTTIEEVAQSQDLTVTSTTTQTTVAAADLIQGKDEPTAPRRPVKRRRIVRDLGMMTMGAVIGGAGVVAGLLYYADASGL